jgi:hypothetical protein
MGARPAEGEEDKDTAEGSGGRCRAICPVEGCGSVCRKIQAHADYHKGLERR